MAEESKGVAYAILGIVAVIAVVGLVLLFKGATAKVAAANQYAKVYGGGEIAHDLDQYQDPMGFVRYSDNRVYAGAGYVFPERIQDTGGAPVPVPTYDSDYKRTGPIKDNPCPYPPYVVKMTAPNAGENCIRSGENPNVGSEGRVPAGYEDFYCCTP
ncbi:MAG: hypothetical protein QXM31_00385 [Candidatus Woesearchaeota archaeon]